MNFFSLIIGCIQCSYNTIPVVLSSINLESKYALNYFKIENVSTDKGKRDIELLGELDEGE